MPERSKHELPKIAVGVMGLPSAGKTTLGDALVRETNIKFLDVDRVTGYLTEGSLKGVPIESLQPWQRIHVTQSGYIAGNEMARDYLAKRDDPVALAATYSFYGYHHMLKDMAKTADVPIVMLQLEPPRTDEEIAEVLRKRQAEGNPSHLTTAEMVRQVEARFQHIQGVPVRNINRQVPLEKRVTQAIDAIEEADMEAGLPYIKLLRGSVDPTEIVVTEPDQSNWYQKVYASPESAAIINKYEQRGMGYRLPLFHRGWISADRLHLEILNPSLGDLGSLPEYDGKFEVGARAPVREVGVSAVIGTSDNQLVLAQRLTPHATKKGGLHLVGGYLDSSDFRAGKLDITHTLEREAAEEAGIDKLRSIKALGLSQNKTTGDIAVLFSAETSLPSDEIRQKETDGEVRLVFIQNTAADLAAVLKRFAMFASTPSLALLHEFGKQRYGNEWSRQVLSNMKDVFQSYQKLTMEERERRRAIQEADLNMIR
jgi:8-oxo-dGTP pyrophosphatase MutT (NUDIX family)